MKQVASTGPQELCDGLGALAALLGALQKGHPMRAPNLALPWIGRQHCPNQGDLAQHRRRAQLNTCATLEQNFGNIAAAQMGGRMKDDPASSNTFTSLQATQAPRRRAAVRLAISTRLDSESPRATTSSLTDLSSQNQAVKARTTRYFQVEAYILKGGLNFGFDELHPSRLYLALVPC